MLQNKYIYKFSKLLYKNSIIRVAFPFRPFCCPARLQNEPLYWITREKTSSFLYPMPWLITRSECHDRIPQEGCLCHYLRCNGTRACVNSDSAIQCEHVFGRGYYHQSCVEAKEDRKPKIRVQSYLEVIVLKTLLARPLLFLATFRFKNSLGRDTWSGLASQHKKLYRFTDRKSVV